MAALLLAKGATPEVPDVVSYDVNHFQLMMTLMD
jgi:hypothetical protein